MIKARYQRYVVVQYVICRTHKHLSVLILKDSLYSTEFTYKCNKDIHSVPLALTCFCLHLSDCPWLTPPASCIRLNMFCLPASPAVAPDTINNHVKTCYEEQKNLHFYAPEYGGRLVFMQSVCLCCYLQSSDLQICKNVKIQSTLLSCFFLVLTVHFFIFKMMMSPQLWISTHSACVPWRWDLSD